MVSEHTLIPTKGERGQRVPRYNRQVWREGQSVQVSDGCRREGYRPTHLVSSMLDRLHMVARRDPTAVTPEDLQSNGLSDQSADGMNSAMVG